ncbi:hypothetical protein SAMN04487950_0452 [Halogranum rubrum]|uniref:Uncharacterized protein n=1 Tax=Halogranum rubrum TaxID=553466 RepID=A0A1I4BCX9_9EURY|nr:hypothetical protein [Halogranum rubrum]SFK66130.1 hypothetical protein SAMN04487950_0452 [Halogranum rubrum]
MGERTAEQPTPDTTQESDTDTGRRSRPAMLASRAFVTWAQLVVVGFAGSALGGATSGPPQLVVYLATTLLSVGVLFYNIDQLIQGRTSDAARP